MERDGDNHIKSTMKEECGCEYIFTFWIIGFRPRGVFSCKIDEIEIHSCLFHQGVKGDANDE